MFRYFGIRRPAARPDVQPEPALRGPMTDEYVRELQKRLAEKRAAAIAELGDRWLFHPSRTIK